MTRAEPRIVFVHFWERGPAVDLARTIRAALDVPNAAALLGALADIDAGSVGTIAGATVRYGPAAATPDACSGYLDLVVPVRTTAAGPRAGTSVLALKVRTAVGTVSERLKLVCRPTFP
jgi:hypothetical protein